MKNIAAIYARLSREDEDKIDGNQESRSIESQVNILKKYAEDNDFLVYDIYIDDGYSGLDFNRPALTKLLNDMKDRKFNVYLSKICLVLEEKHTRLVIWLKIFFQRIISE